jgi:hypothetical protein
MCGINVQLFLLFFRILFKWKFHFYANLMCVSCDGDLARQLFKQKWMADKTISYVLAGNEISITNSTLELKVKSRHFVGQQIYSIWFANGICCDIFCFCVTDLDTAWWQKKIHLREFRQPYMTKKPARRLCGFNICQKQKCKILELSSDCAPGICLFLNRRK